MILTRTARWERISLKIPMVYLVTVQTQRLVPPSVLLSTTDLKICVQFVKISREMHEVIQNAVIPGSFLVDIFPSSTKVLSRCIVSVLDPTATVKFIPSWLPGANFRRLAKVARARGRRVLDGAFDAAKTQAVRVRSNIRIQLHAEHRISRHPPKRPSQSL